MFIRHSRNQHDRNEPHAQSLAIDQNMRPDQIVARTSTDTESASFGALRVLYGKNKRAATTRALNAGGPGQVPTTRASS